MLLSGDTLGRIDKFFLDRDELSLEEIAASRAAVRIALVCGLEVSASATLQAAILTAANAANRCFPGSVSVHLLNVAGSLVVAETLRMLHGGESFESIDLRLASPDTLIARHAPHNYADAMPALSHQRCAAGRIRTVLTV